MSDVRLVPMRVAGEYSRGGLRLVPVAPDHKTAWESGITEEDAQGAIDALVGHGGNNPLFPCEMCLAKDKLRAAFEEQS